MQSNHHRHSIRLQGYDYRQSGAYFVTICTYQKAPLFGHISDQQMHLSPLGQLAADAIVRLMHQFPGLQIPIYVVMPNHIHAILQLPSDCVQPLGIMISQLKGNVTRRASFLKGDAPGAIWQRNYYEHILRDEEETRRCWMYIENNPCQWELDQDYLPERFPIFFKLSLFYLNYQVSLSVGGKRNLTCEVF